VVNLTYNNDITKKAFVEAGILSLLDRFIAKGKEEKITAARIFACFCYSKSVSSAVASGESIYVLAEVLSLGTMQAREKILEAFVYLSLNTRPS
jgi:hypothetical protein